MFCSGIRTHGAHPFRPTWAVGWYIFRSPHLLSFSISPPPRPCYVRPASRFNLNFAPAKPKAALRFFKVTREAISRGDLAHLLERLRARYSPYSSHFRNNVFPFANTFEPYCDGTFFPEYYSSLISHSLILLQLYWDIKSMAFFRRLIEKVHDIDFYLDSRL